MSLAAGTGRQRPGRPLRSGGRPWTDVPVLAPQHRSASLPHRSDAEPEHLSTRSTRGAASGCRARHAFRVLRVAGRPESNRFRASASTRWYGRRGSGAMVCRTPKNAPKDGEGPPHRPVRCALIPRQPLFGGRAPGQWHCRGWLSDRGPARRDTPSRVGARAHRRSSTVTAGSARAGRSTRIRGDRRSNRFGTQAGRRRSGPLTALRNREHRLPPKPLCNPTERSAASSATAYVSATSTEPDWVPPAR